MKTNKKLLIGSTALLAMLAVVWIGLFGVVDDPALGALQREFDAAISKGAGAPAPEQMRERLGSLSDQQRRRFFMRNRDTFMQFAAQRMNALLDLPEEERRREVAAKADRVMEVRANQEAGERTSQPPGGPPNGLSGTGQLSESDMIKRIIEFTSPEMRGAFSETKRLIDEELASRGEPPMHPREMRDVMRLGG